MLFQLTIGIIVLNLALGTSVLLQGKKDLGAKIFFAIATAFSLLSLANFFSLSPNGTDPLFWIRLVMFFAACHTYLFYIFVHVFAVEGASLRSLGRLGFVSLFAFLGIVALTLSSWLFSGITTTDEGRIDIVPGMLLPIFSIWLVGTMLMSMGRVIKQYKTSTGTTRTQWKFLLYGTFTTYGLLVFFNFFFSSFLNNSFFVQFTPLYSLPIIIAIGYAIIKHNIFDIKVLATQAFVFILVIVFIAKVLMATTNAERIVDGIILVLTLGFGALLVRSVKQEVKAREEIAALAEQLSSTNSQLEESNEQLRIIDLRKSEFVSIVSHQLRTPITAIKGYTSLILEDAFGKISEEAKVPIEKIFRSSCRLAEMVTDYLDISKIEQGTMAYAFTTVDVGAMIRDLGDDFIQVAAKKNLSFAVHIPEATKFLATADDGKIRQIFSNLIDNSIKYTPSGGVEIFLEQDALSGKIIVKIKDTGIGLSQDDVHHLFGKFTRGSGGQKQNTEGSGLGLYVAKKMLEAQKGNVWVDSEGPGKGSTFCIELPAQKEVLE